MNTEIQGERLAYRIKDILREFGISRSTFERMRASGEFPPPSKVVGSLLFWSRQAVERWLSGEDVRKPSRTRRAKP